MDSIPYSEIRAHLAETLKKLEVREEPIVISRRGEPAGVLMSVAQYQRLQSKADGPLARWLAWRERHADYLASAEAEEDPFANIRDPSPDGGRPPISFDAPDPSDAPPPSGEAR